MVKLITKKTASSDESPTKNPAECPLNPAIPAVTELFGPGQPHSLLRPGEQLLHAFSNIDCPAWEEFLIPSGKHTKSYWKWPQK